MLLHSFCNSPILVSQTFAKNTLGLRRAWTTSPLMFSCSLSILCLKNGTRSSKIAGFATSGCFAASSTISRYPCFRAWNSFPNVRFLACSTLEKYPSPGASSSLAFCSGSRNLMPLRMCKLARWPRSPRHFLSLSLPVPWRTTAMRSQKSRRPYIVTRLSSSGPSEKFNKMCRIMLVTVSLGAFSEATKSTQSRGSPSMPSNFSFTSSSPIF
mmetsp:Transcript_46994/g.124440  ORF Transcript_46994/g.124440 Transcript_46994/m.124440 type:complete len:212 (-) Transcript_46994:1355-1990(-)